MDRNFMTQTPDNSSISTGTVWVIRVATVLCMLIPLLALGFFAVVTAVDCWQCMSRESALALAYLIPAMAGIVWLDVRALRRLKSTRAEEGLGLALGIGAASLLIALPLVLFLGLHGVSWEEFPIQVALLVPPLALVGIYTSLYHSQPDEPSSAKRLRKGLGWGALYLILVVAPGGTFFVTRAMRPLVEPPQATTVGSVRTIDAEVKEYLEKYHNGYPARLSVLGPKDPNVPQDSGNCRAAGLIDGVLASGMKAGVVFIYRPGPPIENPAKGCPPGVKSYTVTTVPRKWQCTWIRSYFSDESGIIRGSTEDERTATVHDPALGG
jgi:hypothetical protein